MSLLALACRPSPGPGLVVVIADDLGVDALAAYEDVWQGEERTYAETPTIDGICAEGVRFEQAWSYPTCSPSRAAMLTGRHGWRTGIDGPISAEDSDEVGLDAEQPFLPAMLAMKGVRSGLFGKWHLGTAAGPDAPREAGFERFAGTLYGELADFEDWNRTVDGETAREDGYATSVHVDDALEWVGSLEEGEPWMAWLSFTAPHEPFHVPPWRLVREDLEGHHCDDDPDPCFRAALEALDVELERFLRKLDRWDADVEVVFVGDNGSPHRAGAASPGRGKGSLYQGGVHVPLCVRGDGVSSGSESGLAHVLDVHTTVLERFGVEPKEGSDSVSLLEGSRDYGFVETWGLEREWLEGRAVRDAQWKLIDLGEERELYDLYADPSESHNLYGKQEGEVAQAELEQVLSETGSDR